MRVAVTKKKLVGDGPYVSRSWTTPVPTWWCARFQACWCDENKVRHNSAYVSCIINCDKVVVTSPDVFPQQLVRKAPHSPAHSPKILSAMVKHHRFPNLGDGHPSSLIHRDSYIDEKAYHPGMDQWMAINHSSHVTWPTTLPGLLSMANRGPNTNSCWAWRVSPGWAWASRPYSPI